MSAERFAEAFVERLRMEGKHDRPPAGQEPAEGYWRYGIPMPLLRRVVAGFARSFCDLPLLEQRRATKLLLGVGSDEAAQGGVLLLGRALDAHQPFPLQTLDCMADALRDWGATDTLCTNILHPLLLREPDRILPLLRTWSKGGHRWKKRCSVVAFARKVGASGRFTAEGIAACDRLIDDDDDLVRKGIGWALKDLMRGDKAPLIAYVETVRRRGVSSMITLYAMKDLRGAERQRLLAIRPRKGLRSSDD